MTTSEYDHGPVQRYEVVWMSGHVETVLAHQVTMPQHGAFLAAGVLGVMTEVQGPSRILFHAQLDGHWRLTLSALEEDVRSIRLVTESEPIPGAAA